MITSASHMRLPVRSYEARIAVILARSSQLSQDRRAILRQSETVSEQKFGLSAFAVVWGAGPPTDFFRPILGRKLIKRVALEASG